mmetsp:Transcript_102013/g.304366  ORF Transcript_102013/g.304366 Transcript_102013/m.304366 type:complete len:239 (-) Transcript_102013:290-1006(-)
MQARGAGKSVHGLELHGVERHPDMVGAVWHVVPRAVVPGDHTHAFAVVQLASEEHRVSEAAVRVLPTPRPSSHELVTLHQGGVPSKHALRNEVLLVDQPNVVWTPQHDDKKVRAVPKTCVASSHGVYQTDALRGRADGRLAGQLGSVAHLRVGHRPVALREVRTRGTCPQAIAGRQLLVGLGGGVVAGTELRLLRLLLRLQPRERLAQARLLRLQLRERPAQARRAAAGRLQRLLLSR